MRREDELEMKIVWLAFVWVVYREILVLITVLDLAYIDSTRLDLLVMSQGN